MFVPFGQADFLPPGQILRPPRAMHEAIHAAPSPASAQAGFYSFPCMHLTISICYWKSEETIKRPVKTTTSLGNNFVRKWFAYILTPHL